MRLPRIAPAAAVGLFVINIVIPTPRAQGDPFDRYATRPDQWRPAAPADPGVDARGDLNLSVPVLTVPGRAGLDFDITLSYQSGVRYEDRGSWVGTGWRFDPGSITRDVFGVLTTSGSSANVDFDGFPVLQPDAYYVTLPGANATMVRHAGAPGTIRPIRQDSSGFYLTEWRPWRISARTATPVTVAGQQTLFDPPGEPAAVRADFRRFVVTGEDGTRYVFDAPTLATYYGINTQLSGRTSEQYVSTWRLVAVLGPDYQGPEVPTGREDGKWVLLTYGDGTTPGAVISHMAQDPAARPDGADRAPLGQSMVLMEVLTPTHRAVFGTEPRGLENFSTWEQREAVVLHRRLTSITLFSRAAGESGRVVRRVVFEPAQVGFPSTGEGERRLALGGIRFFGRGAAANGQAGPEAPGYRFDYYRMEDEGGDLNTNDDFGYYTTRPYSHGYNGDIDDGKAWSLRSVTYPSGGWEEFEYENDFILPGDNQYSVYNAVTGGTHQASYDVSSNRTRQGGVRVLRIRRYDAVTQSFGSPVAVVTSYAYGPGRLTAPGSLHWSRIYGGYRLYVPQERGRAAVFYDSVERIGQDGSRVVTRYTTSGTHANDVRRVETVVWHWPHQGDGPGGTSNPGGIRAMALAQGNQDWAWGHAYEIEYRNPSRATRRITRSLALAGFEPLAAGPAPALAFAWSAGTPARVEWSYGPRVVVENERDLSATGAEAGPTREYAYNDSRGTGWPTTATGTGLAASVTEVREDGRRRRTTFEYGAAVYPQLVSANRLDAVVREELVELDAAGVPVAWHRATVTRWRSVAGIPPGQTPITSPIYFLPYETWALVVPGPPATRPSFDQWQGGAPAGAWRRQTTNESYDQHALPTRILDARSYSTQLFYDESGRLSRVVRETGSGTSLVNSYTYDPHFGRPSVVTDENNGRTAYSYDDHGRLMEVRDRSGATSLSYSYETPRESDGRMRGTRPDKVTVTRWTGTAPDRSVKVEFFDGLGRSIQTQDLDEDGQYVVNARRYLEPVGAARSVLVREPIRESSNGEFRPYIVFQGPGNLGAAFIEDLPPTMPSEYQNYTETRYLRDGTGRELLRSFPNQGASPISAISYQYDVEVVDGRPLRVTTFRDESQDAVDTWTDGWGHAIRNRRRPTASQASIGLYTETVYNAAGNILTVRPPSYFQPPHGSAADWETRMRYDTRGLLTYRRTPDRGEELFSYDDAGNLRFRQDASRRAAGEFEASRFDAFGRRTLSGTYPLASAGAGDFASLDPTRPYSASPWENDTGRWLTVAAYDTKPQGSVMPWSYFASQVGSFQATFPRGRQVATAARSDGAWQVALTAFDAEARVARRLTYTQDAAGGTPLPAYDTEQRLAYDRQGRLLSRETRLGNPGLWFRHWYDYDQQGRLARAYAGASVSRPALPDVTYSYTEFGAPASVRLGSAPPYDYVHDARRRVVRMGGPVSSGAATHAFQGEYVYTPDGDVLQAAFRQRHATGPETRDYWGYCYDDYDRLRFAARVEGGLPEPQQQCDEAWGISPDTPFSVADLTYDPNGNLLSMTRLDAVGAAVDRLGYLYQPGTNRLSAIVDQGAGGATAWDMEAGPVAHDANSNITQLPAPYSMGGARYDVNDRLLTATVGGRPLTNRYGYGGARYLQRVGATAVEVELNGAPSHPSDAARIAARPMAGVASSESDPGSTVRDTGRRLPPPEPRFAPRFAPGRQPGPAHGEAGAPGDQVTFIAIDALGGGAVATRQPDGSVVFNIVTPAGDVVGRQPAAGGRLYDLRDALGSVRAVVTATGAVVESRAYDAWGLVLAGRSTGPASAAEGFTGKRRDAAVGGQLGGLDDFGARSYAPLLGRFLQVDPAAGDFPGWSPYTYTLNRPASLVDPDGRAPQRAAAVYGEVEDEWRVNRQTGEIERVGSRGGDLVDHYEIGDQRDGAFNADQHVSIERGNGSINMFRVIYGSDYTISTFHSPGSNLEGFILEPGGPATATANQNRRIPEGIYDVDPYSSSRFPNHFILSNHNVSLSRRILFHAGNTADDTMGCLLPGTRMVDGAVTNSGTMWRALSGHLRRNRGAKVNIFEAGYSKVR